MASLILPQPKIDTPPEKTSRQDCQGPNCRSLSGDCMLRDCTCGHDENLRQTTVGAEAVRLLNSGGDEQEAGDLSREMLKSYTDNLIQAAKKGEELYGKSKPFYVCVQSRRERLLSNVIRNQFYPRQTRPTPQYDLALYHYDPRDECLRFVWVIPAKDKVTEILLNASALPEDHGQLLHFCRSFAAGTLL